MKSLFIVLFYLTLAVKVSDNKVNSWYTGDEHCIPPKENSKYSAPYNAFEHSSEYPTFPDANKPGWSCSYQREDGVIIQYGDSRTPQEQWLGIWGGNNNN